MLDLTSFQKTIVSLENSLGVFERAVADKTGEPLFAVIRAGVIHHFEVNYDISHKMLKRFLEVTNPNPALIEEMAFPELIRTGNEKGLLRSGWDIWKIYRHARGTTNHSYDEGKSSAVLAKVPDFLLEARFLLADLEKRNLGAH